MAGLLLLTPLLLLLSFSPDANSKEVTRGPSAAGVFLLMEGTAYTFSFTAAEAACLDLNVTLATMAQMERALRHGLETCKFGWVRERMGVVPRHTADAKCGRGKTGLVTWPAAPQRTFAAFCFDAAAFQGSVGWSTAGPQSSTPAAPWATSSPGTSRSTTTPLWKTSAAPSPSTRAGTTDSPQRSTLSAAPGRPLPETTPSALPPFRHTSSSSSHVITSSPSLTSWTSARASSESVLLQSVSPQKPLGAVSVALIVIGVIFAIVAAAGATCYYKLNISPVLTRRQLKDDIEAEVWRHNNSEMNLHRPHGAADQVEEEEEEEEEDGEEADRKYSSDIMLCVRPDMRTNCPL